MIVLPCGMVFVSKLHTVCAVLSDISFFFFSCSTSRACLCASLEKNVSCQCMFLRTRGKQILSTTLCPPEQVNTDEQRSHSAMVDDGKF